MSPEELSPAWIEVAMRHPEPGALPEADLPAALSLRWFQPGDEALWHEVQDATGLYGTLGRDLFAREFGSSSEHLGARQCFALGPAGNPVGTATAWFGPDGAAEEDGRLHWVAVVPPMQRRGLGRALTLEACRRMLDLGHTGVYLTTGAENLPAIRLYGSLGFRPWARTAIERRAWATLGPGNGIRGP